MSEQILKNARIVLPDRILSGAVRVVDGKIGAVDEGAVSTGEDMEDDLLIPGLVELHTDHLEAHYAPRPGVRWDAMSAVQSHDAQIASSGITTVFDCLRMGSDENGGFQPGEMRDLASTIARAGREGRLRSEHRIHLRCEVSSHDVMDHFAHFEDSGEVGLVSMMDHAPGQRQFTTMDQYIVYYKTNRGMSDAEFDAFVDRRKAASERYAARHRALIAEHCRARGITVASHDDATVDHVEEARRFGVRLAEFPTSLEAAEASHSAGMSVLMGAPNVVRGGSHSGNIAANDLARIGVLDVLSSDYVPFSLIHAPFVLAEKGDAPDLPTAFRMVTDTPARAAGLEDRGRIEPGLRADLVRVRYDGGTPVVRAVWREGRRVA